MAVRERPVALTPAPGRRRLQPSTASTYYLLLAVVGTLLAIGVVMVLSASSVTAFARYGTSYTFFRKQVVWVAAGVLLAGVVSRVDYRRWRIAGGPLLLGSTLALLFVAVHPSAVTVNGSTRWIYLGGGVGVQPSEFAKLALLLFCADVLARKGRLLADVRHLLVPVLPVTLVLAALVMAQPDLGTTMLLCAIAFSLLFIAQGQVLVLAALGILGAGGGLGLIMTESYRRKRLLSFLDPAADPLNKGYQAIQGRLALGSGGLLGVGLGASRQKWMYVPNAHTDFIFAIIGEELGLVGTLAVIALFVLLAYAGIRVARDAPDAFGRYVAGGVTVWIAVQALVNMGAVVGVLPITGVPLPLVSFGGSSLLVLLAAVGILLNVARQGRAGGRPALAPVGAAPGRRTGGQRRPAVRGEAAGRGPGSAARSRARAPAPAKRGGARRQPPGHQPADPPPRPPGQRLTPAQKAKAHAERLVAERAAESRRPGTDRDR